MIKLFDSIASLEFIDLKTAEKKVAAGMHAKDGEYVKFNDNCDCSGPVSSVVIPRPVVWILFTQLFALLLY